MVPSTPPGEVPLELPVEAVHALLQSQPEDCVLIDVREPFEHEIARLSPARLIPMRQIPEHLDSAELPRDKHLLIHCHHGGRSLRVTEFLRSRAYPRVTNVAGGIEAWSLRIDPSVPRY